MYYAYDKAQIPRDLANYLDAGMSITKNRKELKAYIRHVYV